MDVKFVLKVKMQLLHHCININSTEISEKFQIFHHRTTCLYKKFKTVTGNVVSAQTTCIVGNNVYQQSFINVVVVVVGTMMYCARSRCGYDLCDLTVTISNDPVHTLRATAAFISCVHLHLLSRLLTLHTVFVITLVVASYLLELDSGILWHMKVWM
jgi:hypothetical protein